MPTTLPRMMTSLWPSWRRETTLCEVILRRKHTVFAQLRSQSCASSTAKEVEIVEVVDFVEEERVLMSQCCRPNLPCLAAKCPMLAAQRLGMFGY